MQHVGTTLPNIVGIVLADVGFRVFNIYPKLFAKLQCCHVRPPRWRSMNTDDGKRENASLLLLLSAILNTPRHINKNRELKQ